MNLAKRLDDLARKKAELEAEEEFEDDFQQFDWLPSIRKNEISASRGHGRHPPAVSRQAEQEEEEEVDDEEMEENGVDDEMEEGEDDQQISSKQGTCTAVCCSKCLSV